MVLVHQQSSIDGKKEDIKVAKHISNKNNQEEASLQR
jgi:hypothetical protein